jgi:hypothetical protein
MEKGPRVFRSTVVKPYYVDPAEEPSIEPTKAEPTGAATDRQKEGPRGQQAVGDNLTRRGSPDSDVESVAVQTLTQRAWQSRL